MSERTVLVCCGVNRRPVTFFSGGDTQQTDLDSLKRSVYTAFSDVLVEDPGVSLVVQVFITSFLIADNWRLVFSLIWASL